VQNYHALETEAAHRRFEHERRIATAGQVAQTRPEHGSKRWSRLPRLAFAHLRSLSTPRLALASSGNIAVERSSAKTLEAGRAAVT
jgi:hypothetical protein